MLIKNTKFKTSYLSKFLMLTLSFNAYYCNSMIWASTEKEALQPVAEGLPSQKGPQVSFPMDQYDYIIIGAGASGSALVGHLLNNNTEDKILGKGKKILVLEAGARNDKEDNIKNYLYSGSLTSTKYDWGDTTVPQKNLNFRTVSMHTGKVAGGGSSINGMLWARGHENDYNDWVKDDPQNRDWDGTTIYNHFDDLEDIKNPLVLQEPTTKALASESKILPEFKIKKIPITQLRYPLGVEFLHIAHAMGYPSLEQESYLKNLRQGAFHPFLNVDVSKKQTNASSEEEQVIERHDAFTCFVRPFLHLSTSATPGDPHFESGDNLDVLYEARVINLDFDQVLNNPCKITHVNFLWKNAFYKTEAAQEVILSAGALRTPQILMLSEIGNEDFLSKVGISPPKVKLEHVGKNLQDHVSTAIVRRLNHKKFTETSINSLKSLPVNEKKPEKKMIEYIDNFSPINSNNENTKSFMHPLNPLFHLNTTEFTVFFTPRLNKDENTLGSSSTRVDGPTFQMQSYFSPSHDGKEEGFIGTAVIQLRPQSHGTVKLASANFLDAPLIDPQYLSNDADLEKQKMALKETRKLMDVYSMVFDSWVKDEVYPGKQVDFAKDKELKAYIREFTTSYGHPAGTCRMGKDASDSVVDYKLKVHGFSNLRIADASIMPSLVSANTNATAMMIGINCARFIWEQRVLTGNKN